jgi:glutamine synthetase
MLTLDELRAEVEAGRIDTVLLAMADMQGRLQGKRLAATHFLDDVLHHNAEGCNYLLAVDVDMNTVSGYAMSSWDLGYGDFVFKPDLSTLRMVPWQEGTVLVMCDLESGGRQPGPGLAPGGAPAPAGAAGRARPGRLRRHRARVHRVPRQLRGRLGQGLP